MLPAKSMMSLTARPEIVPAKVAGLSSLSNPLPSANETVWVEITEFVNSSAAWSSIRNDPWVGAVPPVTAPPI